MDEPGPLDEQSDLSTLPPAALNPPLAPKTSPWVWVALSLSIVAVLSALALPLIALAGVIGIAISDIGPGDDYYVDQHSVVNAVERPCEDMLAASARIDLNGSARNEAASLKRWARSAQRIVTAIDNAHPNIDSKAWRDDWTATIVAVDSYAAHLGEPKNRLHLPDTLEDMYWATDADCGVPISIAALDPTYAKWMLGE